MSKKTKLPIGPAEPSWMKRALGKALKGKPQAHLSPHDYLKSLSKPKKKSPQDVDPLGVTRLLTPQEIRQYVQSGVNTKFGGAERQVRRERAVSDRVQSNISDWYGRYRQELDALNAKQAQTYRGAVAQAQQLGGRAPGLVASAGAEPGLDTGQAGLRGAQVNPGVAQQAVQAGQSQGALSSGFGALIAGQGANMGAVGASRVAGAGAMEAGAHTAENARKAQLGQQLVDLLGKKGDYANQLKLQLRDGLVKQYEFAQALGQKEQAAQIAAMLKKLGIDAAAKKAAADRAARKANQDANRNQSGDQFDKLHDPNSPYNPKNQPQAGSGGKNNSGLTPAEARKARASWRTALANARDKSNRHPQYSPGQLEHLFHGDPLLITAAAWMAVYGGVPRATARAMKRENGIHLPVYRPKQPRRPG